MNRKLLISTLLCVGILAFIGVAYPWGSATGDGSRYAAVQETAVMYNNSGADLLAGTVVILDVGGSAASTLGSYITITSQVDSSGVIGVVKDVSCAAGTPCIVVTKGPIDTLILDSTDAVSISRYVGTGLTAGRAGGSPIGLRAGDGILGWALEAGDGTDTGKAFIWVSPR